MSRARTEVQEVFVDRDEPLATLRSSFERVRSEGRGAAVVIRGPRGVGKTTLAKRFLNEIESASHEALVLRAGGREFAKSPYSALFEMFSLLLKSGSRIARSKRIAKIVLDLAKLVPAFESMAAALSDVVTDISALTETDKRIISSSMYVDNLFFSLFEELSRKTPVVAFFDDVQSFDTSSLEALCYLLERSSVLRCLVILSFREDSQYPQRKPDNLVEVLNLFATTDFENCLIIDLNPLIRTDSIKLATELAKDRLTTKELELLAAKSEGIPYRIDRTIRNLTRVETHGYSTQDVRERLLASESVSDPIQWALMQIKKEDLEMRILLDHAAILGEKFALDELASLMQRDALELVHHLEELQLVYGVVKKDPNDHEYRFDHSMTREAILKALGDSAQIIHKKAARMYELTGTSPGLAAMHYDEAQRPDLALHFYVEASRAASRNLSFAESVSYLARGIELSKRLETVTEERRLSLLLMLGQSQFAGGKFVDSYGTAMTILDELSSRKALASKHYEAEAKLILGRSCRYIGTAEAGAAGIKNLKGACDIFEELGEQAKLCSAYSALSTILDHFSRHDEAISYFGKAQKSLNLSNDRIGLAVLARKSGMIFDSRRAVEFIGSAIATFRSVGATIEVARCQNNLGAEQFYLGDFQAAMENLLNSAKIYRSVNSYEVDIPLNNLGLVYIQLKDYPAARTTLSEAYDRASEDFNRICAGMNIATLDWLEHGPEKAIGGLDRLLPLVNRSGEPLIQDYFGFNRASFLASEGKTQEALEWIEKYSINEWKGDRELALAKRLRLKASILKGMRRIDESEELSLKAEEIFRTTRPQKWFYLLDYYPCDIHVLD